MKNSKLFFATALLMCIMPAFALAWVPGDSLIPPCGHDESQPECGFSDLIKLGGNIVDALFILSIPVVALVFAYAGFLYLTALGDQGKVKDARKIFTKVLTGFVIMLCAWLLVKFIQDNLLDTTFKVPDEVKLNN